MTSNISDATESDGVVGSPVDRVEDREFTTGRATYTDDIEVPRAGHAAVYRSQYAHAEIHEIDTSAAEAIDGVTAVFTAEDMDEANTPAPRKIPSMSTDYIEVPPELFRPVIARDKVRYQGEPLAIAIAEDRYLAQDAIDAIDVDYERLDSVTDPEEALSEDAPTLHENYEDNLAYEWEFGDEEAVEEAFAEADHTAHVSIDEQRVIPDALEPRAAIAKYDSGSEDLTIHMSTQTPHSDRSALSGIIRHPEHKIHVEAPRVGGGFGAKIHNYDVEALVPWVARELEQPIKWQAKRTEIHQTSSHGRGLNYEGDIALDDEGNILAIRTEGLADVGGYVSSHVHMLTTIFSVDLIPGQYDLPELHARIEGALTNATPLDSFRGVHEVSAITFTERLVSAAAEEIGMDPAEIRRKNFIPSDAFPYESVTGQRYDSGNYEKALDRALDLADYDEIRERQEDQSEDDDTYLGVGLSCYAHVSGVGPADICKKAGIFKTHWESGRVTINPSGTVTAYCGTMDFGMGHDTAYAQILSDELGVPIEDIEVIEGDTRQLNDGTGTHASRSLVVGGSALVESARDVVEDAREIAAHELEAAAEDVEFENGEFYISGAPERSITIQDIASSAHRAFDLPDTTEPGLESTAYWLPDELTMTTGSHVAVVEIDAETGEIEFENYVAVDDVGNRVNPKIVEGQLHGGIAQGIAQAMYEDVAYDESGNMMTSSLQDYAMPKSYHVPEMEIDGISTPSPDNPLGAKGVGESGPTAANVAVVNAICDALGSFDFGEEIDTPITAEDVWRITHDQQ